jgi:hypothetical protein
MSPINSRDRKVRIVATAATFLLALTLGAAAEAHRPIPRNDRDHRGVAATPPGKGTIDPSKAVVRDHRSSAGSGASAIPTGRK